MDSERAKAWRHVDGDLFQFATTDLHELRAAIMLVFDESSVLRPSLGFDEVLRGLREQGWDEPIEEARLQTSLAALVGWGLLDATQDHAARYSTPEEFEKKNLQWSLTPRGQAATAGFLRAFEVLRATVSLQPAVLDAMADGLIELRKLVTTDAAESRITTRLAEVEQHHESLVANVRQFNGQLQRLLREDAASDEVFQDVKQQTLAYLREYLRDLERPARRLARGIRALEEVGVTEMQERALVGANLAPTPGRDSWGTWLAERERRWKALTAWFAPKPGQAAQIESLRRVANQAILQLLRVLDRRWQARRRSASAERDFRVLAQCFGEASSEATAHQLFHAAFGLWSARHADLVEGDHFTSRDTSWCDAPAAVVAPSLRASGTQTSRGRTRAVRDPSTLRAERQKRQAAELQRNAALRAQLVTAGVARLSAFGLLPPGPFAELLSLLAAALSSSPRSDGTRRATSDDGQVEIVLTNAQLGAAPARLQTHDGVLLSPDYQVEIQLLGQAILGTTQAEQSYGG